MANKTTKLLVNGEAGSGKTELLKGLEDAYVIYIDGKDFPLGIPHTTYKANVTMEELIEGYEIEEDVIEKGKVVTKTVAIEGIVVKLDKYVAKFGKYPKTIVLDSVSKLANNIIEKGNTDFTNFDIHSHIKKDLGLINKFITEYLEARCDNIVLLNHVVKKDGEYQQTGSGNFKDKGGFYAEVDEAITVIASSEKKRKVITRGKNFQARTLHDFPTEIPIPYVDKVDPSKSDEVTDDHFDLQTYLDVLGDSKAIADEWEL